MICITFVRLRLLGEKFCPSRTGEAQSTVCFGLQPVNVTRLTLVVYQHR
eukprot:SAG22_NODE_175_length_16235_cov_67.112729_4_plen_49_part_00